MLLVDIKYRVGVGGRAVVVCQRDHLLVAVDLAAYLALVIEIVQVLVLISPAVLEHLAAHIAVLRAVV